MLAYGYWKDVIGIAVGFHFNRNKTLLSFVLLKNVPGNGKWKQK